MKFVFSDVYVFLFINFSASCFTHIRLTQLCSSVNLFKETEKTRWFSLDVSPVLSPQEAVFVLVFLSSTL